MTTQPFLHSVQGNNARFESGSETVDNGAAAAAPPAPPTSGGGDSERGARSMKARPDKAIPTDRLRFDNQVRVLQYVAQASGNTRRGCDAEDMSAALDLKSGTGGLNSKFFQAAGWFEPVGRGAYTASAGAIEWNRHIAIDADGQYAAAAGLRREVTSSWFWETLGPILESGQPISKKVALLELAKAAGATNHTLQLETILDWLDWVGMIIREADQVRLRTESSGDDEDGADQALSATVVDVAVDTDAVSSDGSAAGEPAPPAGLPESDAVVSFNLSVRLTADNVRELDQEQRDFILALAERLRG
jgi:hypothetical protein